MITKNKRPFFSFIAILLIVTTYSWQNINVHRYKSPGSVICSDIISYYAYLPATFIEKDHKLHFLDDPTKGFKLYWPTRLPNGELIIKTDRKSVV